MYDREKEKLRQHLAQEYLGAELETQFREQSKNLLRNLIDQSLLVQKAKDDDINVETNMVKRLDEIRKTANLATLEDLKTQVQKAGEHYEDFKNKVRRDLLMTVVISREVGSRITVSREDERKYYESHKDAFKTPGMVRLGGVRISTEKRKSEEAEKRAKEALAELKGRATFANVAKKYPMTLAPSKVGHGTYGEADAGAGY
jgi:parvulin-like peptidyl-prolyl isomerase